jgi:integrase/recombinase XerC
LPRRVSSARRGKATIVQPRKTLRDGGSERRGLTPHAFNGAVVVQPSGGPYPARPRHVHSVRSPSLVDRRILLKAAIAPVTTRYNWPHMTGPYRSQSAPTTLPQSHVTALLDITRDFGSDARSKMIARRDHTILMLALTVALREHEITALTITDVYDSGHRAREYVSLRVFKGHRRANGTQEVFMPDEAREALDHFLRLKHAARESLEVDAPVFVGRRGRALSTRQVRHAFHVWQERAGLSRSYNVHALRHTACTAVYEQSRDLRATQIFARHASIVNTEIYTHPSRDAINADVSAAAASWRAPIGRRYPPRR